jgi:transcriptional regulator with XRE-family HTH domain
MAFEMPGSIDSHVGRRLRKLRRLRSLTLLNLATTAGVTFQQIQKYEAGLNRMSAASLWRLARRLDVPIDYFFEDLDGP